MSWESWKAETTDGTSEAWLQLPVEVTTTGDIGDLVFDLVSGAAADIADEGDEERFVARVIDRMRAHLHQHGYRGGATSTHSYCDCGSRLHGSYVDREFRLKCVASGTIVYTHDAEEVSS